MKICEVTYFKILRALVATLKTSKAAKPRVHPNGFVQLNLTLDGSVRLHVWTDPPITAQKTNHPVHDHSFDMHSTVLRGTMRNIIYEKQAISRGVADLRGCMTYKLYRAEPLDGTSTVLVPVGDEYTRYTLNQEEFEVVRAGDSYTMEKGVLHDSQPFGACCTLMTKTANDPSYRPLVAVPYNVDPDNEHRRDEYDLNHLWEVIHWAIN